MSGECLPTFYRLLEATEPPSNNMPLEWEAWIDLWQILPGTWTEPGEKKQKEGIYNLLNMSKGVWKQTMPRLQGVVDFPRFNRTDIEWYIRMPTDPSLVDPKEEMKPKLCEETGASLEPSFPER